MELVRIWLVNYLYNGVSMAKEKIKLEVIVELEYDNKKDRRMLIESAKDGVSCYAMGGAGSKGRYSHKIVKVKQIKENK